MSSVDIRDVRKSFGVADKIVVMHDGIVEQMRTPLELYDRPENQFVARFIGSPAMPRSTPRPSSGPSETAVFPNGRNWMEFPAVDKYIDVGVAGRIVRSTGRKSHAAGLETITH